MITMRTYQEIEDQIKILETKHDTIIESDMYGLVATILDAWNDYKTSRQDNVLEYLDVLLDSYEEKRKIYKKLEEAASTTPTRYIEPRSITGEDMDEFDRLLIEEAMERVHIKSKLREHDNEVHNIFRETLGWMFNKFDSIEMLRSFMLKNATGVYLDEYAYQFGLTRRDDESDESLRARILAYLKELFRVRDVKDSGIELFTYVENPITQLTSKNTYLSHKYLAHGEEPIMDYWENRYITRGGIVWF